MTDRLDAPPSFDELPPAVARWAERRRWVARQVAEQPATDPVVFAARLVERIPVDAGDQPIMSLTTPSQ